MNSTGHYWCDHCEEPAFGQACQKCRQPARWVVDRPLRGDVAAIQERQTKQTHEFTPVPPERARELFAELKAQLGGKS